MHGMVYENMRSGGTLGRKPKEDTNEYQRNERMFTPDKTPVREVQPGQEQLLHEEHLHIRNMGIMMFLGRHVMRSNVRSIIRWKQEKKWR